MQRLTVVSAAALVFVAACSDRVAEPDSSDQPFRNTLATATEIFASATVVTGSTHSCALTTAGKAYCWGYNAYGQLGVPSVDCVTNKPCNFLPVAVRGGLTFRLITAGGSHACGLTPSGEVYCWGLNQNGQLGVSTTQTCGYAGDRCSDTPRRVGGGFVDLGAGSAHTCALTSSGQAVCWGANYNQQLGAPGGPGPVTVTGGHTFTSLSVGAMHTCGLTSANVAYCWGANNAGQLGDATTSSSQTPVRVVGGLIFSSLASGSSHTCGVTATTMAAYGSARTAYASVAAAMDAGRLLGRAVRNGLHRARAVISPVALPAAPTGFALQVRSSSRIDLTWNDASGNEAGFEIARRIGDGIWVSLQKTATDVTSFSSTGLTEGTRYTYRVRAFNASGNSAWSNLATGLTRLNTPTQLTAASARGHIALGWKDNSGKEGGYDIDRKTGFTSYVRIARIGANSTGYRDSIALNGVTYTYRVRAYNSATTSAWSATASTTAGGDIAIPAAPSKLTAIAISASRIDLTWTDESTNEAGFVIVRTYPAIGFFEEIARTGPNVTSYSSTGLLTATTYTFQVKAYNAMGESAYSNPASATTLTVPAGGNAYCWGSNVSGQLGINQLVDVVSTPTKVHGGIIFRALSAGAEHTCGTAATGSGYCWGSNASAQLGNGAYGVSGSTRTPGPIAGNLFWSRVNAGGSHSCGVTAGGQTYCWGSHFYGQIGNGQVPPYSLDMRFPTPSAVLNP